ncbi:MAG: divalent-cation tolerance protein CutA [Opitutales bacterium]|nr:divalent-cation tolerance protein CutA [Opitutales bacterium]
MANSDSRATRDDASLFVCWTTFDSADEARDFGEELVAKGIVACAQLDSPIEAIYQWEGKGYQSQEFRLWLKILEPCLPAAREHLAEVHPHDTPQWIECRAEEVEEKYLKSAKDAASFHGFQNQESE